MAAVSGGIAPLPVATCKAVFPSKSAFFSASRSARRGLQNLCTQCPVSCRDPAVDALRTTSTGHQQGTFVFRQERGHFHFAVTPLWAHRRHARWCVLAIATFAGAGSCSRSFWVIARPTPRRSNLMPRAQRLTPQCAHSALPRYMVIRNVGIGAMSVRRPQWELGRFRSTCTASADTRP
jgi:hypothetical protein